MVRTRFAPSPTGLLHIGGVRTALFSWAYAKKRGGEFVLRIEDTDQKRSTQESVAVILQGLKWLNLDYQQGPYFQSQRFNRYREVIQDLLQAGRLTIVIPAVKSYPSKEITRKNKASVFFMTAPGVQKKARLYPLSLKA